MAKIKTNPDMDSTSQVVWLDQISGTGFDKVIVTVDADRHALRVIAPTGEEVIFYAGERAPKSMDPDQGYANYPEIQVFLRPERDELREDWVVKIKDGKVHVTDCRCSIHEGRRVPGRAPRDVEFTGPGSVASLGFVPSSELHHMSPVLDGIEALAREMFPVEYAAITDDKPMNPAKVRMVKLEMARRERAEAAHRLQQTKAEYEQQAGMLHQ